MTISRNAKWAVAPVAVIAAAASAGALAATHGSAIVLGDKQAVTHAGIVCTAYGANSAPNANLVCVRNTLKGYGVIVNSKTVIVAKLTNGKLKVIFQHANR